MNVQSKEFWLKVKEEYRKDVISLGSSRTFKSAMYVNEQKDHIWSMAHEFIKDTNQNVTIGEKYLFPYESYGIRIQFIDHMINKYS